MVVAVACTSNPSISKANASVRYTIKTLWENKRTRVGGDATKIFLMALKTGEKFFHKLLTKLPYNSSISVE